MRPLLTPRKGRVGLVVQEDTRNIVKTHVPSKPCVRIVGGGLGVVPRIVDLGMCKSGFAVGSSLETSCVGVVVAPLVGGSCVGGVIFWTGGLVSCSTPVWHEGAEVHGEGGVSFIVGFAHGRREVA